MIQLPTPFAHAAFHVLAFALIFAAPVWGLALVAWIKAERSSQARLLGYQLGIVSLLLSTLAAFLLVQPAMFFDIRPQNRGVSWIPSRELISGLASCLVLMTALPALLARRSGAFRVNFQQQLERLRDVLPQSRKERLWFGMAALSAGLCEEVLYRGFLLYYLHVSPGHLNIATALVISCLVYGLVHLYQGVDGFLQTIMLGLGLSVLFLSSRSLLLPMALHFFIDLRIFMVLPVSPRASERWG